MMERILQLLSIRCSHKHMTQPFAAVVASRAATAPSSDWESVGPSSGPSHYVVCLDCGKKFSYDWAQMRILR